MIIEFEKKSFHRLNSRNLFGLFRLHKAKKDGKTIKLITNP